MTQRTYTTYGNKIHAWRNEIKHTISMVSQDTRIPEQRLKILESGEDKPTWSELEHLAKHFCISVRDLLPNENDLDRGIKYLRTKDARKIEQSRQGRIQYTYRSKVMTTMLPNIKPIELLLHLHQREEVVMNHGHFFHQYTEVLHGGPVAFLWQWNGESYEEIFREGDSWLIPGFIPHGFYSPDKERPGRILAITFGQHLTGDAREELQLIGKENASRIISDEGDYYPHGESENPCF